MSLVSVTRTAEDPAAGHARSGFGKVREVIGRYLQITKPGIVAGNLISVAGGFFLAAKGHVDPVRLLATLVGVSLVVASGCIFNNVIDRDIDVKMARTRNRVLVKGLVAPGAALVFGAFLGLIGVGLLYVRANTLSAILVVLGFAIYVGAYSLYMKRHSVYGTLVGSFSGAAPPVVGYCAVSGRFDLGAALLLLIFSLWQMPHSYAIAIFRFNDYAAAGIPVQPVSRGIASAKRHIVLYILAFTVAAAMLTVGGYAGYAYLAVAVAIGLYWLWLAVSGYRAADDRVWARKVFVCSIITITALSVMMSIDFHGPNLGLSLLRNPFG
jgi:protoheme IX farnesyltransferase